VVAESPNPFSSSSSCRFSTCPYQKVHLVVHHDNPTRDLNAARAVGDLPSARTPSPLV
jgi:hypothetical protein